MVAHLPYAAELQDFNPFSSQCSKNTVYGLVSFPTKLRTQTKKICKDWLVSLLNS